MVIRGDEKSGLRREAVGSQVIDALEAPEITKNSGALLSARDSAASIAIGLSAPVCGRDLHR